MVLEPFYIPERVIQAGREACLASDGETPVCSFAQAEALIRGALAEWGIEEEFLRDVGNGRDRRLVTRFEQEVIG